MLTSVGVRELPSRINPPAAAGESPEEPTSKTRATPTQITAAKPTWQREQSQSRPDPGYRAHRLVPRL